MITNPIFSGTALTSTAAGVGQVIGANSPWVSVFLNITAVSGTNPQAVFHIQWSFDGTNWADSEPQDSFDPITAPTTAVKRFDAKAPYWRAAVDITGTSPSFTGSANAYS